MIRLERFEQDLRCPRCRSPLSGLQCTNADCTYASGFPAVRGQPVLIDFEDSIFDRADYEGGKGWSEGALYSNSLGAKLERATRGRHRHAEAAADLMLDRLAGKTPKPRLLVIGGGTVGAGAQALYDSDAIELIGSDVVATPNTSLVFDGHRIPFADASLDAVWIQAVLEHVLTPPTVVDEIWRVLRPGGIVYAATPFMQQVHEGAYDFTRYTLSGHRWLFRRFEQISAGVEGGTGTVVQWSVRYMLRALGWPSKLVNACGLSLWWLRGADNSKHRDLDADGASGTYFIGAKSDASLGPKDMPAYYRERGRL